MTDPFPSWSDSVRAVQAAAVAKDRAREAARDAAVEVAESLAASGRVRKSLVARYATLDTAAGAAATDYRDAVSARRLILEARAAEHRERVAS